MFFSPIPQVTAAVVRARVHFLSEGVCGEEHHRHFSPRGCWWLLSQGKAASRAHPYAIPFLEQIGLTDDNMVEAFEKKFWRRSFEVLFPQLVCHKWGASDLLWVSVKHLPGTLDAEGKPVTEGGRPDHNNIVTSDVSWKYGSLALRRFIDNGANLFNELSRVWDEDYLARTLLGVQVLTRASMKASLAEKRPALGVHAVNDIAKNMFGAGDGEDDDDEDEEEEDAHASQSSQSASRNTQSSDSGSTGATNGAAVPANPSTDIGTRTNLPQTDRCMPVTEPQGRDGIVSKVEVLTQDFMSLRISQSSKPFNKREMKQIRHLHYETAQVLRQGGDEITATPKGGGTPLQFVRVAKSKGGTSKSTISRATAAAKHVLKKQSDGSDAKVSAAVEKKVAENMDNVIVEFDSKMRQLIVPDEGDQLAISEIVGSDNKVRLMNSLIAKTTGFLMVKPGFSLAKATDSDLPSFVISTEQLLVDGKKKPRRTFRVKSISEVISSEIQRIINSGCFVASSKICKVDDDKILVRFLGDKGGTFMQFKFGLSVMNQPDPNSTSALELLGTMEAFDTYPNLHDALFKHWKLELDLLFSGTDTDYRCDYDDGDGEQVEAEAAIQGETGGTTTTSTGDGNDDGDGVDNANEINNNDSAGNDGLPRVLCAMDGDGEDSKCVCAVVVSSSVVEPPAEPLAFDPSDSPEPSIDAITESGASLRYLSHEGKIWGLASLQDDTLGIGNVHKFHRSLPIEDLKLKAYKLLSLLGGDIEFLHTVLGLQSCSATWPCLYCLIKLEELRKSTNFKSGKLRTLSKMKEMLGKVLAGSSIKEKKKLARDNGSHIHNPLIPAGRKRVSFPVLHLVLGIFKKLWDELMMEVQKVDKENCQDMTAIQKARDNLRLWVEDRKKDEEAAKNELDKAEEKRKAAYNQYQEVCNRHVNFGSQEERVQYGIAYDSTKKLLDAARAEKNAAKSNYQQYKSPFYDAVSDVLDGLNAFVNTKRGVGEHAAEETISKQPISAKHNPFYGQSFNGNDTMRLLANVERIFEAIVEAQGDAVTEDVEKKYAQHKKCWDLFAELAPLLRTTRRLSPAEEETLLKLIDDFLVAYEAINASITIKIHILVHLFLFLDEYGPPGLFAEDSIESGHAVINQLGRRYAPLDEKRRIQQILRAWKGRKIVRGGGENKKKKAKAAAASSDGTGSKKRKHLQGSGAGDGSAVEEATVKAIARCVGILTDVEDGNDDEGEHGNREIQIPRDLYRCEKCSEHLDEDKEVPVCFRELHDLLYHRATEDKHYAKKQKIE